MADLQDLFARLKAQSSEAQSPQSQTQSTQLSSIWANPEQTANSNIHNQQTPAVTSPGLAPLIQTLTPKPSSSISNITSPTSTMTSMDQARTNSLLNLLKFNGNAGIAPASGLAGLQNVAVQNVSVPRSSSDSRPLSAQDLVASMQRNPSGPMPSRSPLPTPSIAESTKSATPSNNQQDFLLNLLKRPTNGVQRAPTAASTTSTTTHLDTVHASPTAAIDRNVIEQPEAIAHLTEDSATSKGVQPAEVASLETGLSTPRNNKPGIFNYINPFDQLHSSSPLNSVPKTHAAHAPSNIQSGSQQPPEIGQLDGTAQSQSKPPAYPPHELISSDSNGKSVSEELENVGQEVDKQVEKALAEAVANSADVAPTATTKTETTKEDDVESNWESAEDSANEKKDYRVPVYNFPMKPFVTIQINGPTGEAVPIRQDNFMVIAALKKEFDQVDRTLATASQSHIVYAQTATKKDNKGFRIIRQDTGDHKSIFRSAGERIFSVQVCSPPGANSDTESILGTGDGGSVFWTSVMKSQADLFSEEDLEGRGFIMPPIPTPEESTSGSPVKTRAKLSNRHTEIFALARGKHIHLVLPAVAGKAPYRNATTHKVDSKQYFAEHNFCIHTTKAGKDFCFSEDDTLIASLDKSGRVKFWDIRQMISRAADRVASARDSHELREPLMQLSAAASGTRIDEKPSVSSIMLLDKERPHAKGIALRYMLIGFKQNHILQLWDLGLGKAVQEVRLPHEKDSDGICSVAYHPKTGILAVGHPTRNSVYFLHLSAPKYNVPFMDQARYVEMLARGDAALPRPESTAIMSGLRELSFGQIGQLRSLDMLKSPVETANENGPEDETLFELYALHSKGVVGIGIKRADLGWNGESRMQHPVDAVQAGVIEVTELKLTPAKEAAAPEATVVSEATPKKVAEKSKKVETNKAAQKIEAAKKEIAPQTPGRVASSVAEVPEAKSVATKTPTAVNPPFVTPESYTLVAQQVKSPIREKSITYDAPQPETRKEPTPSAPVVPVVKPEPSTARSVDIKPYFDNLYQRIDADKRVSDAAAGAKQDALLRLVSSTLTDNVEQTLHRIIDASIRDQIVPTLAGSIAALVDSKLNELVPQQINSTMTREINALLPSSLGVALKEPQFHQAVAKITAEQVSERTNLHITNSHQSSLNTIGAVVQRAVADVERRSTSQLREAEARHQQDVARIDELTALVRNMSGMLQRMAENQAVLQDQLAALHQPKSHTEASELPATDISAQTQAPVTLSLEEQEIQDITQELMAGSYEDATVQWLKSPRQAQLFDQLFIRVNPQYLQHVSPLVALSVAAAVTAPLESNVDQRLDWLATVLARQDLHHEDVRDVTPQILRVLIERLQSAYISISEDNTQSPMTLRKIGTLVRQVTELRRLTG